VQVLRLTLDSVHTHCKLLGSAVSQSQEEIDNEHLEIETLLEHIRLIVKTHHPEFIYNVHNSLYLIGFSISILTPLVESLVQLL
jgi:hypothetical protein